MSTGLHFSDQFLAHAGPLTPFLLFREGESPCGMLPLALPVIFALISFLWLTILVNYGPIDRDREHTFLSLKSALY